MGQALMSASRCVSDLNNSFLLHSFHCYFVGPMQDNPEVTFKVNRVKDGTNFCSVSVVAVQDGKVCFHCLVSFKKPESVGTELDYSAHPMPKVPHPSDPAVIMSELTDSDKFTVSARKILLLTRGRWEVFKKIFPLEVYVSTDMATAKRKLSGKPILPKLVAIQ